MEEEEEKGLTLIDICKIIFKRVWWVVGATAAAMILVLCVVKFWYNPSKQYYSAKYEVRIPSGDKYPDGTELRIEDSVLLANLQDIKDEKYTPEAERTGKFANLDIVKMVEEDDITFVQTIDKMEDETYKYHNNVRVSRKYFKDVKVAEAFVRAVVEFPVIKAQNIVGELNYTEWLARYEKYSTYEEKINALIEQKNYIETTYNSLKTLYGGEYSPVAGTTKTLDDYLRDLTNVFDAREQEAVKNTVVASYYVWDTKKYLDDAENNKAKYSIDITKNEVIISALQKKRSELNEGRDIIAIEAYEVEIAKYTVENARLSNDIDEIDETCRRIEAYTNGDGVVAKKAFDDRLKGISTELNELSQTLRSVNIATYAEKSMTIYVSNKITVEGGFSIILAAVVGALVGFLVASVVVFIIDYPKYKKAKLAEADAVAEDNARQDGSTEE